MVIDLVEDEMSKTVTRTQKRFFLILGVALLFLLVTGLSIQQFMTAQAQISAKPTIPVDPSLLGLQSQLQKDNIDSEYRHILETKVGVLSYNATRQVEGMAKLPANRPTFMAAVTEVDIPDSKRETGIIANPPVPFPSSDYQIENGWREKINGNFVHVLAGADGSDPQQGILIVITEHPLKFNYFKTPQKQGAVKIVKVQGLQLVLQTKANETIYFDVPGRTFISALGEAVPTVIPAPAQQITPATNMVSTPIPAYP